MRFEYPVAFKRSDDGTEVISARDVPEVASQAKKKENTWFVAEGALQAAIEYRVLNGLNIPQPSPARRGERLVALPPETAAKAALYMVMRERGISKLELARQLKINEKEVRRMLHPGHSTKIPRIAEVLRSLGRSLRMELI